MYSYFDPALLTIIENTTDGTFHPVVFLVAPFPGGSKISHECNRYRSKMHHTTGFKTLQDAIDYLPDLVVWVKEKVTVGIEPKYLKSFQVIKWEGDGVPSMTPIISDDDICDVCKYK